MVTGQRHRSYIRGRWTFLGRGRNTLSCSNWPAESIACFLIEIYRKSQKCATGELDADVCRRCHCVDRTIKIVNYSRWHLLLEHPSTVLVCILPVWRASSTWNETDLIESGSEYLWKNINVKSLRKNLAIHCNWMSHLSEFYFAFFSYDFFSSTFCLAKG